MIALVSSEKAAIAREAGAHEVVNYRSEDITAAHERVEARAGAKVLVRLQAPPGPQS